MVVFVVTWYAVRKAKKWRYAVRKAKIRRYAVRKGGSSSSLTSTVFLTMLPNEDGTCSLIHQLFQTTLTAVQHAELVPTKLTHNTLYNALHAHNTVK